MSEFDALLEELGLLAKSKPDADDKADDAKIKGAADGDQDNDGESDGEDAADDWDHDEPDYDEDGEDTDGDGDGKPMKKSFTAWLEDGSEVEAIDGTLLVKSLQDEMVQQQQDTHYALSQVADALRQHTALIKSLRADNAAMHARVAKLADQGRGRKSALSVHEKTPLGQSEADTREAVSPRAVLHKALDAQAHGRITGGEVAIVEGYVNRGMDVPAHLLARIG